MMGTLFTALQFIDICVFYCSIQLRSPWQIHSPNFKQLLLCSTPYVAPVGNLDRNRRYLRFTILHDLHRVYFELKSWSWLSISTVWGLRVDLNSLECSWRLVIRRSYMPSGGGEHSVRRWIKCTSEGVPISYRFTLRNISISIDAGYSSGATITW